MKKKVKRIEIGEIIFGKKDHLAQKRRVRQLGKDNKIKKLWSEATPTLDKNVRWHFGIGKWIFIKGTSVPKYMKNYQKQGKILWIEELATALKQEGER